MFFFYFSKHIVDYVRANKKVWSCRQYFPGTHVDLDFFSVWCAEPHLRILHSLYEVLTQETTSHNEWVEISSWILLEMDR